MGRAVSRDGLARAGREAGEQRQGPALEGSAGGCKSPVPLVASWFYYFLVWWEGRGCLGLSGCFLEGVDLESFHQS